MAIIVNNEDRRREINASISRLEEQRIEYTVMKNKIADSIQKLGVAKGKIQTAYEQLEKAYKSEETQERVQTMKEKYNEIETLMAKLYEYSTDHIPKKIKEINNRIWELETERNRLSTKALRVED